MTMTINKFLARYYGIEINYNIRYSHKELKKLFSFLIPYNYKGDKEISLSEKDNFSSKKKKKNIVYVTDSYGKCIPYEAPNVPIEGYDVKETVVYLEKSEIDVFDEDILPDLAKLSMYELGRLLSRYKGKPSFYKVIRRELEKRGRYTSKIHKLEIRNERLKESGINDKYQRRQRVKCKKS